MSEYENSKGGPRPTNGEVIEEAELMLGQTRETLNRILTLSGPSPERLSKVRELRQRASECHLIFNQIREVDTSKESVRLEKLVRERGDLENAIHSLRQGLQRKDLDEGAIKALQETIDDFEKRVPDLAREIGALQQVILNGIQKEMSAPASDERMNFLESLRSLVREAGAFESEQRRGLLVNVGTEIIFAYDVRQFTEARDHHRLMAKWMLFVMGIIVVGGAVAIMLLFEDLTMECVGKFNGVVEDVKVVERVLLAGFGRVAVLALIAWALAYTGGLHRSHSAQAILYHDRLAGLGVISNLVRTTTELSQKHDLLNGVLRGYLGFDRNAFRADFALGARGKRRSAASQVKELVDIARPIVDVVSKVNKKD